MTELEAKERAERIATLFVSKEKQVELGDWVVNWETYRNWLAQEIARELQRVATECGWQKEELARLQNEVIGQLAWNELCTMCKVNKSFIDRQMIDAGE